MSGPVPVVFIASGSDEDLKLVFALKKQMMIYQNLRAAVLLGAPEEDADEKIVLPHPFMDKFSEGSVVLLCVSSDYLSSEYCLSMQHEALAMKDSGACIVIPVILSSCDWKESRIGKLSALPSEGKPVNTWSNLDEATYNIASSLEKTLMPKSR